MRTAVCDDNKIFLEEMKRILENNPRIKSVETFLSPVELLFEIDNGAKFDLIFMDLDWGTKEEKNGLEWGEEICKEIPQTPMIFVTGYNDRFAQHVLLTNTNLLGYLTKPINENVLESYLEKAGKKCSSPKYLAINVHGAKISLDVNEIIYIESDDHRIYIYTEKENYVVYEKLNDVQVRLTSDFIRCHKSFLVNMKHISTMEKKIMRLRNGKEIPISRTRNQEVREEFFRFLGEGI